jgi:Type II secretion system (T2SS), protein G
MKTRFKHIGGIGAVAVIVTASVLLFAGSDDTLSVKKARELIQQIAGANMKKDRVVIKEVVSGVNGDVIVEAQIETSFRMTKENGDWQIAEIRLGDRHWESFDLIEEAIAREKIRRTTILLEQLAKALTAYHRERGKFAETEDIAQLLDFLSPIYINRPPRFDLWGEQFQYRGTATTYRLVSSGPDRKQGTKDDLVIENGVIRSMSE